MTSALRRTIAAAALAMTGVIGVASCAVEGNPVRPGRDIGTDTGRVDTDTFERLLEECDILPTVKIGEAVGLALRSRTSLPLLL